MKVFDERKILEDFVTRIKNEIGPHLQRVILFGSRAKGKSLPWSDFDLLVVLDKKERSIIDKIYDKGMDFLLEYGADISLKIYSLSDFERMSALPTPFMAEIKDTGISLWETEKK